MSTMVLQSLQCNAVKLKKLSKRVKNANAREEINTVCHEVVTMSTCRKSADVAL